MNCAFQTKTCGVVMSLPGSPVTLFDVGSLLVDEGARRYPTAMDAGLEETGEERGLLMSTEAGGCCGQSECGCLVYRAHFLLRLL